jgi:hypothetical protein
MLGILCLAFGVPERSSAQAPPANEPSADTGIEPPRLLEFPPVDVPEGVTLPEGGRIEVTVEVAADATATLFECALGEALCALVRAALPRARFEPARRGDAPLAARIRIALQLADSAPALPPASAPASSPAPAPTPAPASAPADPSEELGATAHVIKPQPGMRRLELAETRDLPGAFGDPFRAIEALPGVVPIISGLPYVFVRGSPPAGTLYVYDEIPVPTLFHLGLGPAVIHPRMVGPVRLYSGVAPARYGRLTGGVVVGEGPAPPDGRTHAEVELRLLDVSGYVQAQGLGGNVTGAVRYGYPALLLSIFSPEVNLAYWDYQLRYTTAISARDRFELVALGSYDSFSEVDDPEEDVTITFHRVEPRLIRRLGRSELGSALLVGYEESELGDAEFELNALRLAPRLWLDSRFEGRTRLRLSADLTGVAGNFAGAPAEQDDGIARQSLFGDVPARSMWGVQAELTLWPLSALELQLGARADAWVQGPGAEGVLDPSARAIWHVVPELDLHVAGGVVHQPAVFYIPLPGIVDVATDRGLQSAIQSEAGVGWDTPLDLRAELQAFVHVYRNLVFVDALLLEDSFDLICETIDCGGATLAERIDGVSYGAELFLRRAPEERLSGFLSYTLAWSHVDDVGGLPYTPTWDVRHLGNLIVQWEIGAGFSAGGRLHARSGKLIGEFLLDDSFALARDEHRLPWFVRIDLQVAYAWRPSWGRMRVALEWFNATLSREPINTECKGAPRTCEVEYLPAIFFPNLGVRGEI